MTVLVHLVGDHVPSGTEASTNGHLAVLCNGYGNDQPLNRSTLPQTYHRQSPTENNGGRNDDRTRDCSLTGRNRGVQRWHTFICFFRGLSASTLDLLGCVVCGVPTKEYQLVQT